MDVSIDDPKLFSWQAGEDSDPKFLERSFYSGAHEELKQFFDESSKFRIVVSKKGVGKSTLLYANKINKEANDNTKAIFVPYDDLDALSTSGEVKSLSIKEKVAKYINLIIGKEIKFSINSTNMELTDSAIKYGSRKNGLLGLILEKFNFPFLGITHRDKIEKTPSELLKSYMISSNETIWIMVDDVDANFVNNEENRNKIYNFLKACKELSMSIDKLFIRCSLRNNVWTTLRTHFEALDKYDNFIYKLNWSNDDVVKILRSQTIAYFDGNNVLEVTGVLRNFSDLYEPYMNQLFENDFKWGAKFVEPFVPISYYSTGRPRWALKMCRECADLANSKGIRRIDHRSFIQMQEKFSQERILDVCAENRHQCPKIDEVVYLLQAFPSEFTRNKLYEHVEKVLQFKKEEFKIDGKEVTPNSVIDFLYSIGILIIREISESGKYRYFAYDQIPNPTVALDIYSENYSYIIPLVYQKGLRNKKVNNKKFYKK